jgi:hypothetical protein
LVRGRSEQSSPQITQTFGEFPMPLALLSSRTSGIVPNHRPGGTSSIVCRVAAAIAATLSGVVFGRAATENSAGSRSVDDHPGFSAADRWLTTEETGPRWTGGIAQNGPAFGDAAA